MSFRDELSASIKTPQQVAREKEDAEIACAKMCVKMIMRVLKEN